MTSSSRPAKSPTHTLGKQGDGLTPSFFMCQKKWVVSVLLFSLVVNVLFLVVPLYSMQVFDRVLSSRSLDTLLMLGGVALFLLIVQALVDWARHQAAVSMVYLMEQSLLPRCLSIDVSKSAAAKRPTSASLAQLRLLKSTLSNAHIFSVFDALFIPLFVAVMFLMHPLLGWLTIAAIVALLCVALINLWWVGKQSKRAQALSGPVERRLSSWLQASELIVGTRMLDALVRHWRPLNAEGMEGNLNAHKSLNSVTVFSKWLRLLLQLAVLSLSVVLVLEAQVSPGVMIAASIIVSRALAPIEVMISQWRHWLRAREAYQALESTLLKTHHPKNVLPAMRGRISFDHVVYQPSEGAAAVVDDLSFELPSSSTILLTGPSGVGKSSLLRLIAGIIEPTSGAVSIDGARIQQWSDEQWANSVGYLPQEPKLLDGTILDNITLFHHDEQRELNAIHAAELAGVHELITSLPNGYQSEIGDQQLNLSPGQTQRIGLARALYNQPALLLLDEPDSALDKQGIDALIQAIHAQKQRGCTVVIISHRQELTKVGDYHLRFEHSRSVTLSPIRTVVAHASPIRKEVASR